MEAMQSLELLRQQRALEPKDDLRPYSGEWVVLRGGHVEGSALALADLLADGQIADEDALLLVPREDPQ